MRPTVEEVLLATARAWAQRSTCSRLQVGAVLARSGRIISTGYNGAVAGAEHCHHDTDTPCEVSEHAERNVISFAARHGVATEGTQLFVTHSPCVTCARILINAGITEVVFGELYRSSDGVEVLRASGVLVRQLLVN